MIRFQIVRWLPAILLMGVIYWLSSLPGPELPNFAWADRLIKKSGHVSGYGLLAVSYWFALTLRGNYIRHAWLLAVLYAITDEVHQSFVPGRNGSIWDVLMFDNVGALFGLWLANRQISKRDAG